MATGDSSVRACYQAGVAAWPALTVSLAEFERLAGSRCESLRDAGPDGAELYLACACALGDAAALAAFDRHVAPGVPAALRRMKLDAAATSDVLQQLRLRLFVAPSGEVPRIVGYAGTGKLGALVHVAATRLALDALRGGRRTAPEAASEERAAAPAALDPGGLLAKAELRRALRAAFEEAAALLPPRDRTLLRMSVLDGLSIDELATVHRVHRATVARWLVAAREALTQGARARFITLAGLAGDELAQAGDLVESQLSVSLERLLSSTR